MRDVDVFRHFLYKKQCVTQGGTLAMISYGIGILPLIFEICAVYPHITQLWYADYSGAGGKFAALQNHMQDLVVRGPPQGYFPEPTKSILVVSLRNFPR